MLKKEATCYKKSKLLQSGKMSQRTANGGHTKGLEGACSATQSGSSSISSLFLICFINIFAIIIITIIIIMAIATSAKIRLTHAGLGENSMCSPMSTYSLVWLSTHIEYAHNKLLYLTPPMSTINPVVCYWHFWEYNARRIVEKMGRRTGGHGGHFSRLLKPIWFP